VAKSKTKKRQEGANFTAQIQQAAGGQGDGGGAWNRNPDTPGNPKLAKLEDKQVLNRLGNQREKTKGDPGQLKSLKQQIKKPTTKNLVPGANGQMQAPNAEIRSQLRSLRQGLSKRRGLRQEAERRDIRPKPAGRDKQGGMTAEAPPGLPKPPPAGTTPPAMGAVPQPPAGIPGPLRPPGVQRPKPIRNRRPKPGRVATPRGF
jgi:hypothetical protein